MVNVRGLSDPPSVHASEKTTIKNGVIVRKTVWKDTMGNEYKKVGNKYIPKHNQFMGRELLTFQVNPQTGAMNATNANSETNSSGWTDEDFITGFMYLCIVSIMISIVFTLWTVYSSMRNKNRNRVPPQSGFNNSTTNAAPRPGRSSVTHPASTSVR